MGTTTAPNWNWESTLRTVGALLDDAEVAQVCIVELNDQVVYVQGVQGRQPYAQRFTAATIEETQHAARRRRTFTGSAWTKPEVTGQEGHKMSTERPPRSKNYETILREVGLWAKRKQMHSIVIIELEQGVVLRGMVETPGMDGKAVTVAEQVLFDNATLDAMAAAAPQMRGAVE